MTNKIQDNCFSEV